MKIDTVWKGIAVVLVATIAMMAAGLIIRLVVTLLVLDLVFGGHRGSELLNDLRRKLRM